MNGARRDLRRAKGGPSGGTLIRPRSGGPQAWRRRRVPRRGHSRHNQGAAAIGRLLRGGLSGLADLPPHGRARRRKGRARRSRRAFRDVRFGSDRRGDAFGVGDVSAPRRSHVEIDGRNQCRRRRAVQSFVRRRHRRGADHHRRGLRRGLVHHAGAQPRLRAEIANLASRSSPESADAGAHGGRGLRAVRGVEHAGHARSAHPHLSCSRTVRRQGQPETKIHLARGAGKSGARRQPDRSAARFVPARKGEARAEATCGDRIRQGA